MLDLMKSVKRLVVLVLLMALGQCFAEEPKLFREQSFNAADLAEAANHFIGIGEAASVKELNGLAANHSGEADQRVVHRIGWICRIIFRPKAKDALLPPAYGALFDLGDLCVHKTVDDIIKEWPLFPVALSGSTYFVLSDRYSLGGRSQDLKEYVAYCQTNGVFMTTLLKVPTEQQALKDAAALRRSKAWRAIKWEDKKLGESYGSEPQSWSFIQNQAESISHP